MAIWTAVLGIANKLLGFAERADRKQERREDMQTGAKIHNAEELEAENAELRKDAKVWARPGGVKSALARALGRAKLRERASGDD